MPNEKIEALILKMIEEEGGKATASDVLDRLIGCHVSERRARTAVWSLLEEGILDLGEGLRLTLGKRATVA